MLMKVELILYNAFARVFFCITKYDYVLTVTTNVLCLKLRLPTSEFVYFVVYYVGLLSLQAVHIVNA
jgi:hypothetical protein